MSASKAKRQRQHMARNQGINVEQSRGMTPDFSTHTRQTPTKHERIIRQQKKHRIFEHA